MTDKPTFVSRDMMTVDEGYVQWMADKLNFSESWNRGKKKGENRLQSVGDFCKIK